MTEWLKEITSKLKAMVYWDGVLLGSHNSVKAMDYSLWMFPVNIIIIVLFFQTTESSNFIVCSLQAGSFIEL